jgi:cytoskeletal protein RodZ
MPDQTRDAKDQPVTVAVRLPAQRPAVSLDLPALRQKNNLTLEQIAETTKISSRFLKAIEAEQYASLPGGIFNTSYLRQYARCIGFDEDVLLARYHDAVTPEPEVMVAELATPKTSPPSLRQLFRWLRIGLPA